MTLPRDIPITAYLADIPNIQKIPGLDNGFQVLGRKFFFIL